MEALLKIAEHTVDKDALIFVGLPFAVDGELYNVAAALNHAMCVLVIACPCALGLAAPIALICSIGKGASAGILIKNGSILEQLAKTRVVVFDKTGTLTTGKFTVLRIDSLHEKWNSDKILAIAAALEK